jgi:uncharacterized protein YgfB (UPF0149 family)
MTTLTIDTHDFFTQLKQAGVPEQQAEVFTRLHQQAITATIEHVKHEHNLDDVATKRDIKELELTFEAKLRETELKIELVKSDLKRDIAESKDDLRKWMTTVVFGTAILQTAIIAALVLLWQGIFNDCHNQI